MKRIALIIVVLPVLAVMAVPEVLRTARVVLAEVWANN